MINEPENIATSDRRRRAVESVLGNLLSAGVIASLVVTVAGMVLLFAQHPDYLSAGHDIGQVVGTGQGYPHTPLTVFRGALALEGKAVIMLGILLLIATPVMRVIASIAAFAFQRDWIFTSITTAVLLILLLSFWLGKL